MATHRVLVTGFGPFLDHAVNPTEALARQLSGRRVSGVQFIALTPLPVVYGEAARRALFASTDAVAVVALGLAAKSDRVRLESRALNRCRSASPDGRGEVRAGREVRPGAPAGLPAGLPLAPVRAALAAAGVGCDLSDDAGGYVCNDLYYRLLHAGRLALFVHVPPEVDVRRLAQPLALGIAAAVRSVRWPPRISPASLSRRSISPSW